jgi:hypothetical protein
MAGRGKGAPPLGAPVTRRVFLLGSSALLLTACRSSRNSTSAAAGSTSSQPTGSPVQFSAAAGSSPSMDDWLQDATVNVGMSFVGGEEAPALQLSGTFGSYPVSLKISPNAASPNAAMTAPCTGNVGPHTFDFTIQFDQGAYYEPSWSGPIDGQQIAITTTPGSGAETYGFTGTLGGIAVSGTADDSFPTAKLFGSYGDGSFSFQRTDLQDPTLPTWHITGSVNAGGRSGATDVTLKTAPGALTGNGSATVYTGKSSGPMPGLILPMVFMTSTIIQ